MLPPIAADTTIENIHDINPIQEMATEQPLSSTISGEKEVV
jgi:hypothetical protein